MFDALGFHIRLNYQFDVISKLFDPFDRVIIIKLRRRFENIAPANKFKICKSIIAGIFAFTDNKLFCFQWALNKETLTAHAAFLDGLQPGQGEMEITSSNVKLLLDDCVTSHDETLDSNLPDFAKHKLSLPFESQKDRSCFLNVTPF